MGSVAGPGCAGRALAACGRTIWAPGLHLTSGHRRCRTRGRGPRARGTVPDGSNRCRCPAQRARLRKTLEGRGRLRPAVSGATGSVDVSRETSGWLSGLPLCPGEVSTSHLRAQREPPGSVMHRPGGALVGMRMTVRPGPPYDGARNNDPVRLRRCGLPQSVQHVVCCVAVHSCVSVCPLGAQAAQHTAEAVGWVPGVRYLGDPLGRRLGGDGGGCLCAAPVP